MRNQGHFSRAAEALTNPGSPPSRFMYSRSARSSTAGLAQNSRLLLLWRRWFRPSQYLCLRRLNSVRRGWWASISRASAARRLLSTVPHRLNTSPICSSSSRFQAASLRIWWTVARASASGSYPLQIQPYPASRPPRPRTRLKSRRRRSQRVRGLTNIFPRHLAQATALSPTVMVQVNWFSGPGSSSVLSCGPR